MDLKRKINATSEVVLKGVERQDHVRGAEIPEEKGQACKGFIWRSFVPLQAEQQKSLQAGKFMKRRQDLLIKPTWQLYS